MWWCVHPPSHSTTARTQQHSQNNQTGRGKWLCIKPQFARTPFYFLFLCSRQGKFSKSIGHPIIQKMLEPIFGFQLLVCHRIIQEGMCADLLQRCGATRCHCTLSTTTITPRSLACLVAASPPTHTYAHTPPGSHHGRGPDVRLLRRQAEEVSGSTWVCARVCVWRTVSHHGVLPHVRYTLLGVGVVRALWERGCVTGWVRVWGCSGLGQCVDCAYGCVGVGGGGGRRRQLGGCV